MSGWNQSTKVEVRVQERTIELVEANAQLQLQITRQQAEQKIREQAALLDIATDAILVQCLEHEIFFWNKGAERLYGWLAEEACNKNVRWSWTRIRLNSKMLLSMRG